MQSQTTEAGQAALQSLFSGLVRLGQELEILLGGGLSFYWAGYNLAAVSLATLVLLHYALSGARIAWLLEQ